MLPQTLSPMEVRVLGSLVEKELSTPEHYPLSLNALANACNQSSNRDPVMSLDENSLTAAINVLRRLNLVRSFQASGSRVPKYQHLLAVEGELSRTELAVLCVLMLRGPQTMAEVRSRATRLLQSNDSDTIEAALNALVERGPSGPVSRLPRRPGQKEVRYSHLLSGEPAAPDDAVEERPQQHATDRLTALEDITRELRSEVADLRAQFAAFRRQFE